MAESIPVTDYKDLKKFYTKRPQNRDPAQSHMRTINALDTETYNGNIFLIADSEGRYLDKNITAESVILFLFQKRYQNAWNFFYNLGYDAEVILKLLGTKLNLYRRTGRLSFLHNGYKIHYIPNKCLRIKKGHHSVVFYDIAQFYGGSLVNAYQKNIGQLDRKYLEIKSNRKSFSPTFYRRNRNIVRNYCIQDCKLTKELAEKWIKLFHDAFGFHPSRWISSGYLAEKVLINNNVDIPKFNEIPCEIQEFAWKCYYGGRFEILKRGFVGTAYLYDINSAYPYAITKIPDLSKGRWISRKSIHKDAKIGFFRILADIPDCKYIPPFPFRKNGIIIFPSGKFETFVTLEELLVCEKKYYKILDSYQFIPETNYYQYKEFIKKMYNKRLELKKKKDPMQLPIKIILNSIYGKTGQKINHVIGNMFNPVIFSFITGYTRAHLYSFVKKYGIEKQVVSFATDSICTTKRLEINSDKLGEFSFEESADDAFFLQNGFYRFNDKWKQRGLGKLGTKEIEHLDTTQRNGRLFYKFKVLRSSRLRSSILQDRILEIGKIKRFEREVNLNADRKRLWLSDLAKINHQSNNSMPICLNYFSNIAI